MADEEDDNKDEDGEGGDAKEEGGGGKKKLILMIVVGLLLVGVSVGGTIAALTMFGEEKAPMVTEGEEGMEGEDGEMGEGGEGEEEMLEDAIYYPIKPSIMVSFEGRGRQRLLQADITLLTRDDDVVASIELHMPMIRNALVLLIGGRTYEEVQTAEGKELLRVDCLQELQRLLEKETGKAGIEQVLFTGLIVQ